MTNRPLPQPLPTREGSSVCGCVGATLRGRPVGDGARPVSTMPHRHSPSTHPLPCGEGDGGRGRFVIASEAKQTRDCALFSLVCFGLRLLFGEGWSLRRTESRRDNILLTVGGAKRNLRKAEYHRQASPAGTTHCPVSVALAGLMVRLAFLSVGYASLHLRLIKFRPVRDCSSLRAKRSKPEKKE
jgi:hypothetical protein